LALSIIISTFAVFEGAQNHGKTYSASIKVSQPKTKSNMIKKTNHVYPMGMA